LIEIRASADLAVDSPTKIFGVDVHQTASGTGTEKLKFASALWARIKAAKGYQNPMSVVEPDPLLRLQKVRRIDRPDRSQSDIDSGTPPRKRPVTHDRVRSTVASVTTSAACEEEWQQNRKDEKTSKRDSLKAGCLQNEMGSVGRR